MCSPTAIQFFQCTLHHLTSNSWFWVILIKCVSNNINSVFFETPRECMASRTSKSMIELNSNVKGVCCVLPVCHHGRVRYHVQTVEPDFLPAAGIRFWLLPQHNWFKLVLQLSAMNLPWSNILGAFVCLCTVNTYIRLRSWGLTLIRGRDPGQTF